METNVLHCGDNLELMRGMEDESVDLIYADPPYFTQKDWGDFDDRFEDMDDYLNFMRPRLVEMKRLMSPDGGGVFMHLNTHASHYIKVMMDDIFGYDNFRHEIIWDYARGISPKNKMGVIHNTIFQYTNHTKCTYNADPIRIPYSESMMNDSRYVGKLNPIGSAPVDVWRILYIGSNAKERTGYQTQKPIELLERIVKMASNPGDIVLDPFMGSGTTLVAAKSLGRKYIGIDLNPDAIEICRRRLDVSVQQTL